MLELRNWAVVSVVLDVGEGLDPLHQVGQLGAGVEHLV